MSPAEYLRRMQPLLNQSKLEQIVSEIVLSDNRNLKEAKVNEWEQGLRPDGDKIGVYRSAEYAIFKDQINPRADGYVDLLLTRQTANTLFVQSLRNRKYLFGMKDYHNLIGRYGLDILGLNQETFEKRQADIYRYTLIYIIKKDYRIA
jgi:hypothetical protein